jgi:pimeloyl-ACP methyl ester carboxylesterase
MSVWEFQHKLSQRLLVWGVLSAAAGSLLIRPGVRQRRRFWRSFGQQALVWGLVDAAIAAFGLLSARRKLAEGPDPDEERRQSERLSRTLWVNTGLDLVYLAAGTALLRREDDSWQGHGAGILLQGGFLALFDLQHALRVPPGPLPEDLPLFKGEDYAGFRLEGGRPAALLVHGFPGTPHEVRPLAESLHRRSWTVQGLLLPGFGRAIHTLADCTADRWLEEVSSALSEMQQEHNPVVLVGFSFGGALSAQAAAMPVDLAAAKGAERRPPDGLVLMAPLLLGGSRWMRGLLSAAPWLLPSHLRPFRWRSFTNPRTRRVMDDALRQASLAGPGQVAALQHLALPLSVMRPLLESAARGVRALPHLDLPVLVVQGRRDRTILPWQTRRMLRRIPGKPAYVEVDSGHDLFDVTAPGWADVERTVLEFAEGLLVPIP